ncbi:hypothetical protein KM043_005825 [Ampulex compressa]|nr:hypothetical protein KM043_005825 [Ampulex compressa]
MRGPRKWKKRCRVADTEKIRSQRKLEGSGKEDLAKGHCSSSPPPPLVALQDSGVNSFANAARLIKPLGRIDEVGGKTRGAELIRSRLNQGGKEEEKPKEEEKKRMSRKRSRWKRKREALALQDSSRLPSGSVPGSTGGYGAKGGGLARKKRRRGGGRERRIEKEGEYQWKTEKDGE